MTSRAQEICLKDRTKEIIWRITYGNGHIPWNDLELNHDMPDSSYEQLLAVYRPTMRPMDVLETWAATQSYDDDWH
jgi:hypothetical protein